MPALSSRLPRPGAWMETLKQALAFPLYATAALLALLLSRQQGSDALGWLFAGLVLLAFSLWASERLRYARRPQWRPLVLSLSLLALWPLWQIHHLPPPASAGQAASDGSVAFSPERLENLRGEQRTVFVNMTADWCVTCKANERRLFSTEAFHGALAARDAVYVKGDWTRMDPQITRFLTAWRRRRAAVRGLPPRTGAGRGAAQHAHQRPDRSRIAGRQVLNRYRPRVRAGAFAALLFASVVAAAATGPASGAGELRLPDLSGKTQSLGQWRGRPVLLNYWATWWCGPCIKEMPDLDAFAGTQSRKGGVQVVGIAPTSPAT